MNLIYDRRFPTLTLARPEIDTNLTMNYPVSFFIKRFTIDSGGRNFAGLKVCRSVANRHVAIFLLFS